MAQVLPENLGNYLEPFKTTKAIINCELSQAEILCSFPLVLIPSLF